MPVLSFNYNEFYFILHINSSGTQEHTRTHIIFVHISSFNCDQCMDINLKLSPTNVRFEKQSNVIVSISCK